MRQEDQNRFWAKVSAVPGRRCWLWTSALNGNGYGVFTVAGRSAAAHRVVWELIYGSIPSGMFVCHHCDTPACCRPDHLFLGTAADNNRDRDQKGRSARGDASGRRKHPESYVNVRPPAPPRGDDHWKHPERRAFGLRNGMNTKPESVRRGEQGTNTKLTEVEVREMRRLYAAGGVSFPKLGRQFGVDTSTAHSIVRRRSWKHVP